MSLKSGGVTSDTNQGINFGLVQSYLSDSSGQENRDALKDDLGDIRCICNQKISKNEIREQLSRACKQ